MTSLPLISRYNYDEFTIEKVEPWMAFDQSPAVGSIAPDYPLAHLDGSGTTLRQIVQANLYTIVEFGSFT